MTISRAWRKAYSLPRSLLHRRLAEGYARSKDDDQDDAVRSDLPVRRDMHEGEEGRGGKCQCQSADHCTDGRDAAAQEFSAAQDDSGNGKQRVAITDSSVRRGGDADKR